MDVQKIMEQVQVYASTCSLVGGRFDDGTRMEQSREEKAEIEAMLREAADEMEAFFQPLRIKKAVAFPLLVDACRFYANEKNWIDSPSWDGDPDCFTPKAVPISPEETQHCDCGDVARLALSASGIPVEVTP